MAILQQWSRFADRQR